MATTTQDLRAELQFQMSLLRLMTAPHTDVAQVSPMRLSEVERAFAVLPSPLRIAAA